MRRLVALPLAAVAVVTLGAGAQAHPVVPVAGECNVKSTHACGPATGTPTVDNALRALDRLARYGYVVNTPARADKAIRHWQRSNGLVVDGIVGPQTLRSLGLSSQVPATVEGPPSPVPSRAPAPPPGDICAEMQQYRIAAGLPEQFDKIGYRESRCLNTVGNSCCYAWWANYLSSHMSRQSAYRDRIINECGVTTSARSEIQGDSDTQKRASACVTYVVWSISGMSPWAL